MTSGAATQRCWREAQGQRAHLQPCWLALAAWACEPERQTHAVDALTMHTVLASWLCAGDAPVPPKNPLRVLGLHCRRRCTHAGMLLLCGEVSVGAPTVPSSLCTLAGHPYSKCDVTNVMQASWPPTQRHTKG